MSTTLTKTTYSMWKDFRNCRRKCKLRYLDNLVSNKKEECLSFGSLIHDCLEEWHSQQESFYEYHDVHGIISRAYQTDEVKKDWQLATAMMLGYARKYKQADFDDFQISYLEKVFEGPIMNPATGKASRSFYLAGKVDGIIKRRDGSLWLMEHKTAAQINESYVERLWTDFQISLYAWYVRKYLGIEVVGILYNILGKTTIKQREGETEEAYQERRQQLIAKSKTGKTSAKRKMPETDEEFQSRLADKYDEEGMFRREEIYLSEDRYEDLQVELWKLTQAFLEARRNDNFYRNTALCYQFSRACPYYPICSSGDNQIVIDNHFHIEAPHEELRCDGQVEENLF